MIEYIEREKAIDALHQHVVEPVDNSMHKASYLAGYNAALEKAELYMMGIPTSDVRPERHGKWVYHHDIHGVHYICSNCNCAMSETNTESYCHYCGAKMERGEENG